MKNKIKLAIVFKNDPLRPILIIADDLVELTQILQGAILKYGDFELMYRIYT